MDAIQRYGGAEPGDRTMVSFNRNTINRTDMQETSFTLTLQETISGTDSDSDPMPVVDSLNWNLNLTLRSVKTSA